MAMPALAQEAQRPVDMALSRELQESIERGDLEKIKAQVNKGNIDARDAEGATPLMLASRDGKKDIVKFLLSKGADMNLSMPGGETALGLAAYYGEREVCELLINSGANLEKPAHGGMYDRTPLLIAVSRQQTDVAKLLISKGANVNVQDKSGMVPDTALAMAAFTRQKELVRMLLGKGAKDPWLSKVPGFDPENVVPITPNKEKGDVRVGGLPFVLGSGFAKRPWTLPPESERSKTGYNLIRWAHPDREKGPLKAVVYEDKRGNETLVSIVPTMYVGGKGILYHQNETSVTAEGPFAQVAILDKNPKIKRVVIERAGIR
jgi:ankyrin repeat protein